MKYLLIVFFAFIIVKLVAQEKDSIKIVIYDPFNANQTIDVKEDLKYDKNLIKWNIGLLARGAFEIDYERAIGDKFTIEVGVGVTYNDWMYFAINQMYDFSDATDKYKYGALFTAGLRFYPNSVVGFDGFYISLPFRYRNYLSTREITYYIDNGIYNNQEYTTTLNNNHKHTEFGFIIGSQTGNSWDVTLDYYFGIGISSLEKTYPVSNYNAPPVQMHSNSIKPVIYCGFRIGIPF